jgi:hypothetical protein
MILNIAWYLIIGIVLELVIWANRDIAEEN